MPCASAHRLRAHRASSEQPVKGNLEQALTVTILIMTLSLIWGGILTFFITLIARGLGAHAPMKLVYTRLAYQSRDFALAGLLFSQRGAAWC